MDFLNNPAVINSAIGAAIGFAVAQLVNLAKLGWWWWWRPVLEIDSYSDDCLLLAHSEQSGPNGEYLREKEYGFTISNKGRSIAPGVRFHLLGIEVRDRNREEFRPALVGSRELFIYTASNAKHGGPQATIVPGASVIVHLASWREDNDAIYPAIYSSTDYYDEGCQGAVEYRFNIAAFAEGIKYTTATLRIPTPK